MACFFFLCGNWCVFFSFKILVLVVLVCSSCFLAGVQTLVVVVVVEFFFFFFFLIVVQLRVDSCFETTCCCTVVSFFFVAMFVEGRGMFVDSSFWLTV